jgi:single-stranded DNA-binding protein
MASNTIELRGRLVNHPELRTTPGGMSVLRLAVDCGEDGEQLRLDVVMVGEQARARAAGLRSGQEIRVSGRLRSAKPANSGFGRNEIEVLATDIVSVPSPGV